MQEFLMLNYIWLKAFHVIAMVCWMAGLFYLPRLFVYHADAQAPETAATFVLMEERLHRIIMNPALVATWTLGLAMVYANPALLQGGWLHAKLFCVVLMTGFHHVLNRWRKDFLHGRNRFPATFYRKVNEVPTVLMVLIVLLVVVKPF